MCACTSASCHLVPPLCAARRPPTCQHGVPLLLAHLVHHAVPREAGIVDLPGPAAARGLAGWPGGSSRLQGASESGMHVLQLHMVHGPAKLGTESEQGMRAAGPPTRMCSPPKFSIAACTTPSAKPGAVTSPALSGPGSVQAASAGCRSAARQRVRTGVAAAFGPCSAPSCPASLAAPHHAAPRTRVADGCAAGVVDEVGGGLGLGGVNVAHHHARAMLSGRGQGRDWGRALLIHGTLALCVPSRCLPLAGLAPQASMTRAAGPPARREWRWLRPRPAPPPSLSPPVGRGGRSASVWASSGEEAGAASQC